MREYAFNWTRFRDLASPEQAARALVEYYGPNAATAAAHCGWAARRDGRDEDFRFWLAVFNRLRTAEPYPAAAVPVSAPK